MNLKMSMIKIFNLALRGKLKLVDDSKDLQTLQVEILKGDVKNDIERYQDYGFTSHPDDESEMVIISPNGNRDQAIAIAVTNRSDRLKNLEKGDVAVYHKNGDVIHFKSGNKIEIKTKTLDISSETEVNINTKTASVTCELSKITASQSAELTASETKITSETSVTITTPALIVSGNIACAGNVACSGLAAGGAAPVAGKTTIKGAVEVDGNIMANEVEDSTGSMSTMRTQYNGHGHPDNGAGSPTVSMD